ncbi:MAG: hypothetical protein HOE90_03655 [Bacteriovoracaceae bacterium]|jgi:hypothetical protein|nr:hypothetical protein [Bacteriovoracaceae bacterium]
MKLLASILVLFSISFNIAAGGGHSEISLPSEINEIYQNTNKKLEGTFYDTGLQKLIVKAYTSTRTVNSKTVGYLVSDMAYHSSEHYEMPFVEISKEKTKLTSFMLDLLEFLDPEEPGTEKTILTMLQFEKDLIKLIDSKPEQTWYMYRYSLSDGGSIYENGVIIYSGERHSVFYRVTYWESV